MLFSLFIPSLSLAKITVIGDQESVRKLQHIDLKGPRGESLYLGHKITKSFFLLGVSIKDDGYVIGVEGQSDIYYPMIKGEKLDQLKTLKLLPEPFPSYKLGIMDYLTGYSFWIALIIVGFYYGGKLLLRKTRPM